MTKRRKPVIIPPLHGWLPHAFYHVECAVDWSNVIHPAIFYTGFLDEKTGAPDAYAGICSHGEHTGYDELSYLRAIKLLLDEDSFKRTHTAPNSKTALDIWGEANN